MASNVLILDMLEYLTGVIEDGLCESHSFSVRGADVALVVRGIRVDEPSSEEEVEATKDDKLEDPTPVPGACTKCCDRALQLHADSTVRCAACGAINPL